MTSLDKAIDKLKAEVEKAKKELAVASLEGTDDLEQQYLSGRYDGLLRALLTLLTIEDFTIEDLTIEDLEGEKL
jgi:hypothetical protein